MAILAMILSLIAIGMAYVALQRTGAGKSVPGGDARPVESLAVVILRNSSRQARQPQGDGREHDYHYEA